MFSITYQRTALNSIYQKDFKKVFEVDHWKQVVHLHRSTSLIEFLGSTDIYTHERRAST